MLHGNGVESLGKVAQESPDAADRIDSLRSHGVKFNICANALKGRNIALDDLHFAEEDDIVPSVSRKSANFSRTDLSILDPENESYA